MKRIKSNFSLLFVSAFFIISCSTVPITERNQLTIIPTSQMLSMSFSQYNQFLKTHELSDNEAKTEMVKSVGRKIASAVEEFFRQKGMAEQIDDYKWEFNLIENEQVNAWAMPGGKVVVYTGILAITQDENGLAVVMGHEIAHAIAEHGNERMSQALLAQLGGLALSQAIEDQPAVTQKLWMTAFGLGAQVGVLLPFSRVQESEADHLGLIFMAIAGYDPHGAVEFWKRMQSLKEGPTIPEFLSTHPSDQTRIEDIKSFMDEAMEYYRKYN